ncbi:hypothetical protein CerSpe_215280 [Prunus speciosa]
MMPAKSKDEDPHIEHGAQTVLESAIYAQPWQRGVGNSSSSGESAPASSLVDHRDSMVMNGAMQSQANARLDGGINFNKKLRTTVGSVKQYGRIFSDIFHSPKGGIYNTRLQTLVGLNLEISGILIT